MNLKSIILEETKKALKEAVDDSFHPAGPRPQGYFDQRRVDAEKKKRADQKSEKSKDPESKKTVSEMHGTDTIQRQNADPRRNQQYQKPQPKEKDVYNPATGKYEKVRDNYGTKKIKETAEDQRISSQDLPDGGEKSVFLLLLKEFPAGVYSSLEFAEQAKEKAIAIGHIYTKENMSIQKMIMNYDEF